MIPLNCVWAFSLISLPWFGILDFQRNSSRGFKLPPQPPAADWGLPLCGRWSGDLVSNWDLGQGILLYLLLIWCFCQRRHWATVMVDWGSWCGPWRQKRRALVAQYVHLIWSHQYLHHHHMGGLCSARCCQLRTVPLCRLPSKPTHYKSSVHARTWYTRLWPTQVQPGLGLPEDNHSPAPDSTWCVLNRDLVQAPNWWGLPGAAGHTWMDIRCGCKESIWAVWKETAGDREQDWTDEQWWAVEEPGGTS